MPKSTALTEIEAAPAPQPAPSPNQPRQHSWRDYGLLLALACCWSSTYPLTKIGLGSCWVGSPMLWLSTPEVRSELKISPDLAPVAVLCLGYPAAIPEPIARERPPIVWT